MSGFNLWAFAPAKPEDLMSIEDKEAKSTTMPASNAKYFVRFRGARLFNR